MAWTEITFHNNVLNLCIALYHSAPSGFKKISRMNQKAKQLSIYQVAEIQLSYHPRMFEKPRIRSSNDAFDIFMDYWNKDTLEYQEHFCTMYLNTSNNVIGIHKNSIGGLTGTVADVRQIMGIALKANARSIILAHNHPSGSLRPSLVDIQLTKQIKKAGKILNIEIYDHLILSNRGYYSFADEGTL